MMNIAREKAKAFLRDALELKAEGEDVRITGIDHSGRGLIIEAEVVERDRTLPKHPVFERKRYTIKLNSDFEVVSYREMKKEGAEEGEEASS
jgi:hypothetical protein